MKHLEQDCSVVLARREAQHQLVEARQKRAAEVVGASTIRINLNVGGRPFTTTAALLTKYDASVLGQVAKAAVDRRVKLVENATRVELFLDRDGDVFAYVLSWLRSGLVPRGLPDYEAQLLLAEARFWELDALLRALGADDVAPPRKSPPLSAARLVASLPDEAAVAEQMPGKKKKKKAVEPVVGVPIDEKAFRQMVAAAQKAGRKLSARGSNLSSTLHFLICVF